MSSLLRLSSGSTGLAAAEASSRPVLRPPATEQPAVPYVVGNTAALLWGLLVAYFTLRASGAFSPRLLRSVDFMSFYSAWRLVLEGQGGSIYHLSTLGHMEASVTGGPYSVLPYIYPAYFALLFAPLAALPYDLSFLGWVILNSTLLVISLYILERYLSVQGRRAVLLRLVVISFLPVFLALGLGQSTIIILALLLGVFVASRTGRDVPAGIALALVLIKPTYVAPLVVVFLLLRRWRTLAAFAVTALTLFVIPIPLFGPSVDGAYARLLMAANAWQGHVIGFTDQGQSIAPAVFIPQSNHSFTGFTQLLLSPGAAGVVRTLLSVLVILVLARTTLRSRSVDLAFALAVVVGLLVSTHTLVYDLALLLIPIAVTIRHRAEGPARLTPLLLAVYLMCILGYRLAFSVPLQISVVAMCALALWLFFAAESHVREGLVLGVPLRDGLSRSAS